MLFWKIWKKRYDRYSLKKNIFLGEIIDIQSFKYFCEKRREEKKLMKINFELIPIKTTKHDEISRYMIKYEIIFYGTVNNDDDTRIRSQINVCTHRYLHMYWSSESLAVLAIHTDWIIHPDTVNLSIQIYRLYLNLHKGVSFSSFLFFFFVPRIIHSLII